MLNVKMPIEISELEKTIYASKHDEFELFHLPQTSLPLAHPVILIEA
jgi:hypothetical protein